MSEPASSPVHRGTTAPRAGRPGLAPARPPARIGGGRVELRTVMGQFATGVTVLTAGGPAAHGMTANSFTSLSLTPPLVLCCVAKAARMHAAILAADAFAVSVLAAGQGAVARHFADWRRPAGMAQFDEMDVRLGAHTGSPLLNGALAWIECSLAAVHEGGDHSIFVGAVLACGRGEADPALAFFDGDYRVLEPARRARARTREAS